MTYSNTDIKCHTPHSGDSQDFVRAMRHAISAGLHAAIYSLPKGDGMQWICGTRPLTGSRRLVAVDFAKPYSSGIAIYDEVSPQNALSITGTYGQDAGVHAESTDEREYLRNIDELKDLLRPIGGKVVLSRVICGRSEALAKDIVSVALEYFSHTPNNFNILLHTPQTGTWIISTPERLLSMDLHSGDIATMALAGTMPSTGTNGSSQWDEKNIREQSIVSDEIIRQLHDGGVRDITSSTSDLVSGAVKHICTEIRGQAPSPKAYSKLLDTLSPTPALGGWPRDNALLLIDKYEKHPRRLYGGYISLEDNDNAQSFVTLRCANVDTHGHYCIYTGSGIIACSDAAMERNETALKASILLRSILNQ